jgi:Zn-dependent protease with chaperone function
MLFNFQTRDRKFNEDMSNWRLGAALAYGMSIFWVLVTPFIVTNMQDLVPITSLATWHVRYTIGSWWETYLIVLLATYLFIEFAGWIIVHEKSTQYPAYVDDILRELSLKAGYDNPPRLVYIKSANLINAGAMRSFMFGNKVILFGDITKLSREQLRAVLAHEMAHLMMADVIVGQFARGLLGAVRVLNLTTFAALVLSVFTQDHDMVWFLLVTYLTTLVGSAIARAFYMKYSRICEYRADAIAIQLTSEAHRQHLVDGLKLVRELSLAIALRKSELKEVDAGTHPTFKNRARALGIKLFAARLAKLAS